MNTIGALPRLGITGDPVLARPAVSAGTVKLEDPALNAMTDFLQAIPITVDGETPIDEALQHMIHAGVWLLFVTGRDSRLIGLITSNDLQVFISWNERAGPAKPRSREPRLRAPLMSFVNAWRWRTAERILTR